MQEFSASNSYIGSQSPEEDQDYDVGQPVQICNERDLDVALNNSQILEKFIQPSHEEDQEKSHGLGHGENQVCQENKLIDANDKYYPKKHHQENHQVMNQSEEPLLANHKKNKLFEDDRKQQLGNGEKIKLFEDHRKQPLGTGEKSKLLDDQGYQQNGSCEIKKPYENQEKQKKEPCDEKKLFDNQGKINNGTSEEKKLFDDKEAQCHVDLEDQGCNLTSNGNSRLQKAIETRHYIVAGAALIALVVAVVALVVAVVALASGQSYQDKAKGIKTTEPYTAPPLPDTCDASAHVALVAPPKEYDEKIDTGLFLNDNTSSSTVQHVINVTLLKTGLEILQAGLYRVYYNIHLRLSVNDACADFENEPFKSNVLRRNSYDLSIGDVLLSNTYMCCNCLVSEDSKYISGMYKLNVGDLLQIIWSSKKIPIYFNQQSSFFGLVCISSGNGLV